MSFKLLNTFNSFFKNNISILGFSIPIISELCIFVDWAIFSVASMALETFFTMESLSSELFASGTESMNMFNAILGRVMTLAGVFALFRLAIMLINYMINPENTKKVGQTGTDFIKSCLIAVILLVMSKTIFTELGRFQHLVLSESNLIPKLIYGTDNVTTRGDNAKQFTNEVWTLFFQPNNRATAGAKAAYETVQRGDAEIVTMIGRNYNEFEYFPFVSGICGMMLVYYFIIFCVELGARIIKLLVLQVLSPIPIITSIDPSQKDKLKKFWTTYFSLYFQIFVRVIAFYLAFVVLDLLLEMLDTLNNATNSAMLMAGGGFVIKIILIFSVFQAAKELPKLIEDALSLKLGLPTNGKGSFASVVKGIVGGTAGLVGGGIAGAVGAYGASTATSVGAGAIGAVSGMVRGAIGASRGRNIADSVMHVTGAVRKSNALGGNIRGTGGVGAYYLGGVENFFGGRRRDEATLKEYDKDVEEQEKWQKVYKDENDKRQAVIQGYQGDIQVRNKADQLRDNINHVMEQHFVTMPGGPGTLQQFIENDVEFKRIQRNVEAPTQAGGTYLRDGVQVQDNHANRQKDLDDLVARRSMLTSQYESMKETHYESLFNPNNQANVPAEFTKALTDYNNYLDDHGLASQKITSYRVVPGDKSTSTTFEQMRNLNRNDINSIQSEINKQENEIRFAQTKARMREAKKTNIGNAKDDYIKSDGYVRRNNRKEDPRGRPFRRPPMGPPPGGPGPGPTP